MKTDRNDRARLAAGAAVMLAAMNAAPALARDCLLDTNNDGVATASTDTDGGAESANQPDRLACGPYTNAAASGAVSVGVSSSASGAYSMAAGYLAAAYQRDAIALGNQAEGSSQQAVAIGAYATVQTGAISSTGYAGVAVGYSAYAENGGVAMGKDSDARGGVALGRVSFASDETGAALGVSSVAGSGSSGGSSALRF